jgi:S-DNA-T family DNA segregation ATPase FtsK/SpoIIIE
MGVAAVFAALYLGLCLLTYDRWDPALTSYDAATPGPGNYGGAMGAYISDFLLTIMGYGAFALPVVALVYGMRRLLGSPRRRSNLVGVLMFVVASPMFASLLDLSFGLDGLAGDHAGGVFGHFSARIAVRAFSTMGAYVLALALALASVVLMGPSVFARLFARHPHPLEDSPAPPDPDAGQYDDGGQGGRDDDGYAPDSLTNSFFRPARSYDADEPAVADSGMPSLEDLGIEVIDYSDQDAGPYAPASPPAEEDEEGGSRFDRLLAAIAKKRSLGGQSPDTPPGPPAPERLPEAREPMFPPPSDPGYTGSYRLPGVQLLQSYPAPERAPREELMKVAERLESTFSDFNVKGSVTQVHQGPVVTMCEFQPAPGVKINRVVSLADDLALSMKAQSVRISAIPGKAALGIEIPNRAPATVALRDLITSPAFAASESLLTLVMGRDIFGVPVVADLARMPHLLVAGATGSGKSVFMNSMVMSLLYRARPDQVKTLMIDPKLLELSVYEGIPHQISPVVTNPRDASEMLRRMVFEMERRYRVMSDQGVRNLEGFNASVPPGERMPLIVIFIDELADLMLAASAQVEDSIARLAQMARAAGMHLVVATQRPSVDVITGVIKANFPARVAFQVTAKVDSRTIIEGMGAEQLIGRGDMLFRVPGKKLVRLHGALVTESEVKAAVEHARSQGVPDYSIMASIAEAEQEARSEAEYSEERDDLYNRAIEVAEAAGEVSISSIQRKMKIGYNRAARIVELMEEDGMVGPPKGAGKPRDFMGRR